MNSLVFNQDLFLNAETDILSDYCESLLSSKEFVLNKDQLAWLSDLLDSFDEARTVYAILLIAKQNSLVIKDRIPRLLASESDSIRAACLNILADWPDNFIDDEFISELNPCLNSSRFGNYGKNLYKNLLNKSR